MCEPELHDLGIPPKAPTPLLSRVKQWFVFDKSKLAALGVDAFLTYGVVSNINAGLLISFAWLTFSKASGFSPLAPGQWPRFGTTYFALYATLGTVLRPLRLAAAISLTPTYGRAISWVQARMPFGCRPKLNRTIAVVILTIFGNMGGTCLLIVCGVWLAGLFTGVPALPVGWVSPLGA